MLSVGEGVEHLECSYVFLSIFRKLTKRFCQTILKYIPIRHAKHQKIYIHAEYLQDYLYSQKLESSLLLFGSRLDCGTLTQIEDT